MRETKAAIMLDVRGETSARIVANNTVEYVNAAGNRVIRLHRTDIIEFLPAGRIRLDSGGWQTPTTANRLHRYLVPLGYAVFSKRGQWYACRLPWDSLPQIPFYDGMILPDELCRNNMKAAQQATEHRALARSINRFVATLDKLNPLPLPDNGDCLLCRFDAEKPNTGQGRASWAPEQGNTGSARDTEHLLSHIAEGYMHGTLLINAMRWAGYPDTGIAYHLDRHFTSRTTVKSALSRYLRRKLGLPT